MVIGIDATNLNMGGGRTHIVNMLNSIDWDKHPSDRIVLYAKEELLRKITDHPSIKKVTNKYLNGNLLMRYYWLIFHSKSEYKENDILFSPSGLYCGTFRPYVTMSRNMLLFDKKERKRQGGKLRVKLEISRLLQIFSLKRANGIIFISDYARTSITSQLNLDNHFVIKICHGISSQFKYLPQDRVFERESGHCIELLYVSHIYGYKHPWNVVKATSILKNRGYDVKLKIIGGGDPQAIQKLNDTIKSIPQGDSFISYLGMLPHDKIHTYYKMADIFVYASTCENMPNILIEAMSASLPVACSNYQPMPEFVRDAGLLFDPLDINNIADVVERLIISPQLRTLFGNKAYDYSCSFNWSETAERTLNFLAETHDKFNNK